MSYNILFLDIDGVVNCATTKERHDGVFGLDPEKVLLVKKIIKEAGPAIHIVLSSTWRKSKKSIKYIEETIGPIRDITPIMPLQGGVEAMERGKEIAKWLRRQKFMSDFIVGNYAILDDDSDMLPEQMPNFFKTTWQEGLTEEIANKVINHLKK